MHQMRVAAAVATALHERQMLVVARILHAVGCEALNRLR